MSDMISPAIEQAVDLSIQSRATQSVGQNMYLVNWMARKGSIIPGWWSPSRDTALRQFWKESDHLSGAVYTMESKMTSIPNKVVARDQSIREHVRQAERLTAWIRAAAEFGEGWGAFYAKFVEDLLVCDNGAFAEIIGEGPVTGPIIGQPITIAHLDSYRCLGRDTRVLLSNGSSKSIADIVRGRYPGEVMAVSEDGTLSPRRIIGYHETQLGDRYWLHIELVHARRTYGMTEKLWLTNDHEVLTDSGWKRADLLTLSDKIYTSYNSPNNAQKSLMTGMLLGDSHITRSKNKGNQSLFGTTHSVDQREWLNLKRSAFVGFDATPVRKNKRTLQQELLSTPAFSDLRQLWYPDGKKRIPREFVENYFSPLMLAAWYGDDGNLMKNKQGEPKVRIYTNAFSQEDVEWLCGLLAKYGIQSHPKALVNTTGKTEYFIYVTVKGTKRLFEIIAPYLPECLRYKLPSDCEEFDSSLWNIGSAERYLDSIFEIERGDNGGQATAFCIDVEGDHNFSAAHMIVHNCQRTGDPIYPVLYLDADGKKYKLHYSRVMFTSQMSSPIAEMFGVGFGSVSRCINVAQTLIDILVFKQEKLGSRPHRAIILTQGGLDPKDLSDAFATAEIGMDNQLLSRYSKTVIGGSSSLPEADMKIFELSQLPDGFDEQTSITLGMATIALAFGVDARELFPALSSGATRADALLQHLKQRGKGPGQILEATENLFNYKFLPPHLKFEFDFQDDAQDRQVAEIHQIRSNTRRQDIDSGVADVRIAREMALQDGDIDRSQFERLELDDGRLPDGTDVTALFYSKDPRIKKFLDIGVSDPTDITKHPPEAMVNVIEEQIAEVNAVIVNSSNPDERWAAYQAIAALEALEEDYQPEPEMEQPGKPGFTTQVKNPATRSVDRRVRRVDVTQPNRTTEQSSQGEDTQNADNAD